MLCPPPRSHRHSSRCHFLNMLVLFSPGTVSKGSGLFSPPEWTSDLSVTQLHPALKSKPPPLTHKGPLWPQAHPHFQPATLPVTLCAPATLSLSLFSTSQANFCFKTFPLKSAFCLQIASQMLFLVTFLELHLQPSSQTYAYFLSSFLDLFSSLSNTGILYLFILLGIGLGKKFIQVFCMLLWE